MGSPRGATTWATVALVLGTGAIARAGGAGFVEPGRADKCPVCGMFVARQPDWVAGVRFRDGGYALFDGAKDLFRFWLDLPRYAPARKQADVETIFVTDYYAVRQVDAREAFFVVGSDVLGPMGHELVPFASERDAQEFVADHHGKRILRFGEVTPEIVRQVQ